MPTPCPPLDCIEAKSTAYWSSGPGWLSEPPLVDSGTLNCTVSMGLSQCPAVRKQRAQSVMSQPVHPMGSSRAERGSFERTRSSTGPHWLGGGAKGTPTSSAASVTRFCPVLGNASTSTWTALPLKYADELRHCRRCTAFIVCTAPSRSPVMRRMDSSPASMLPASSTSAKYSRSDVAGSWNTGNEMTTCRPLAASALTAGPESKA